MNNSVIGKLWVHNCDVYRSLYVSNRAGINASMLWTQSDPVVFLEIGPEINDMDEPLAIQSKLVKVLTLDGLVGYEVSEWERYEVTNSSPV